MEFKRAGNKLPENLFETICAFLNRNGGTILLGVSDNKEVVGVDSYTADQMVKDIVSLSNNPQKLFPSFLLEASKIEYQKKTLIHVFIPASSQVHRCNGKVFDRSSEGDFELKSEEQIKNLYLRKNALYTENTIYPYLYESDFCSGIIGKSEENYSHQQTESRVE